MGEFGGHQWVWSGGHKWVWAGEHQWACSLRLSADVVRTASVGAVLRGVGVVFRH